MTWELKTVAHLEWVQDDSGLYALIYHLGGNLVRIDLMNTDNDPVVSFQGKAADVQKTVMRWSENEELGFRPFSLEHAAYIGRELARAELLGVEYVQD